MTTPGAPAFSASTGITMGTTTVDLSVAPRADGTVPCTLACDGQTVVITFGPGGAVDFDIPAQAANPL